MNLDLKIMMGVQLTALDVPAEEILDLSQEYRVWQLAKMLRHDIYGPPTIARSKDVMEVLQLLGYQVKSASSKVTLEPFEAHALVAHLKKEVGK